MAVTPSAPSALSRPLSVGAPITGVGSIFQSPVCSASPSGVRTASAFDSGIECATEISSSENGPTSKRAFSSTSLIGSFSPRPYSASLLRSRAAVNGVA